MKAGIYHGIKSIALEEIEKPVAGADDIVIKVELAGICGTDVHAYLAGGDAVGIYAGNQFGHEFAGVISEVGKNVVDLKAGDRVTISPTARRPVGCGMNTTEIADMTGAFSEYVYVQNAQKDYNVFLLPDTLSFELGVLVEPLSVASHGVAVAELNGDEKAVIYGAGTIGLCTIAALQSKGIRDIIISDISDSRLAIAAQMGAIPFNSKKGDFVEFIKEQWGIHKGNSDEDCIEADVVIDCVGLPFVVQEFMDNAKTLAKLIIVAVHAQNIEVSPYWILAKEATIRGSRGYTAEDIITSIQTLDDKRCRLGKIITQVYRHEELPAAFEKAADAQSSVKVVITYSEGNDRK